MKSLSVLAALAVAGAGLMAGAPAASAQGRNDVPLIPRDVLFGNPDKASPQLSPDGSKIAFLAPLDGVLNVWVAPANDPEAAKPVTADKERTVRVYFWAYTNDHILYLQDVGGDEDWKLFSVNVNTGATTNLTPFDEIIGPDGKPMTDPTLGKKLRPTAQVQEVSHKFPDEILVGVNNRDPRFHDIHRINIRTGEAKLVQKNPGMLGGGMVAGYVTDDNYDVRFAQTFRPDGGADVFKPGEGKDEWVKFMEIPSDDSLTTSPLDFDKSGKILYLRDSRDRDTSALYAMNIETGEKTLIAEDDRADIGGVLIHPTEKRVQAVVTNYDRVQYRFLDNSIKDDFKYLRTVADGDVSISSRTLDDKHWLVTFVMDDGPVRYYRYDRAAKKASFLFTNRKKLEGLPLAKMRPVVVKSRDGLNLVSYYTLPVWADSDGDGKPNEALPTVLLVHGGPWARDSWGFNSLHQLLANRGYAVISTNFRGSTGFGKNFVSAGDGEWAAKMHDDLIDVVDWAIEEGIAAEDRVAIMGGSYGGYATLVGLTFTPDKFAAGVDIVGPSNIITLLDSIPPYWASFAEVFRKRVGDKNTEEGRKLLMERSPLTHVDKIKKPLLIGQGANDPRVKQPESDQIVQAMQAKKIPVTYVLFPDEGHGFARPENNLAFYAVTEAFLSQHIGGRYQPIDDELEDSSIQIPAGAELVPGLSDAKNN